jgi:hypothetical protein
LKSKSAERMVAIGVAGLSLTTVVIYVLRRVEVRIDIRLPRGG